MKQALRHHGQRARLLALRWLMSGRFDSRRAFVLTSAPRSGSTLLAQLLTSMGNASVLFEPLNLRDVPDAAAAGFSWSTYRAPGTVWPAAEAYLTRVFEGRVVNEWTARELTVFDVGRSKRLIVKFVRANRLLPWICERFALPPPILLIRHPCAVVASQLNYGWRGAERPSCPEYLHAHPALQDRLAKTHTEEAYLAAGWCLEYLPAFLAPLPRPWIVLTYEQVLQSPEAILTKIERRWNVRFDKRRAMTKLKVPSRTVSVSGIQGIDGWRKTLTSRQVAAILRVTHDFGLSFYDMQAEADYCSLGALDLTHRLRSLGVLRHA